MWSCFLFKQRLGVEISNIKRQRPRPAKVSSFTVAILFFFEGGDLMWSYKIIWLKEKKISSLAMESCKISKCHQLIWGIIPIWARLFTFRVRNLCCPRKTYFKQFCCFSCVYFSYFLTQEWYKNGTNLKIA